MKICIILELYCKIERKYCQIIRSHSLNIGQNCAEKWLKKQKNITVQAPCSRLTQSIKWDMNSSCFAGSKKYAKKWIEGSWGTQLTSCCKLFRSIFDYGNIEDVFHVMKLSLGQQLPKSLTEISKYEPNRYRDFFPNEKFFTGISNQG